MVNSEILRDHSAHGKPDKVRLADLQDVQQSDGVLPQKVQVVRTPWSFGSAMPASIISQHLEVFFEKIHLRIPHDQTRAQRMAENHNWRPPFSRELVIHLNTVRLDAHAPLREEYQDQ